MIPSEAGSYHSKNDENLTVLDSFFEIIDFFFSIDYNDK